MFYQSFILIVQFWDLSVTGKANIDFPLQIVIEQVVVDKGPAIYFQVRIMCDLMENSGVPMHLLPLLLLVGKGIGLTKLAE